MNDDAALLQNLLDAACEIQQIPAPTGDELERGRYLLSAFQRIGLSEIHRDEVGNIWGLYLAHQADPAKPALIISAHLDTVHPAGSPLDLQFLDDRIKGPGLGDNSLGLAAMLQLAADTVKEEIPHPAGVWFIATVGEEGLGNLRGMLRAVETLGKRALAYLVLEGIGLGNIYHSGLGVERYRIEVNTPGGHSWADFGRPSAIHELSRLITSLINIQLPTTSRTTLNVGTIEGGNSVNSIAAHASATLDLRSENAHHLQWLSAKVDELCTRMVHPHVQMKTTLIGSRPAGAISEDHLLVRLAVETYRQHGVFPRLGSASSDANAPLSRGYPAICIGITHGGEAHTANEYIQTGPILNGYLALKQIVNRVWAISRLVDKRNPRDGAPIS